MKGYSYPAKEFGTFGDEDGEENMTEIMCMLANDHRNMTKILDALQCLTATDQFAGPCGAAEPPPLPSISFR